MNILYSHGKIIIVAVGLLIIFIGLGIYLYMLDRRISKIEKEKSKNNFS